MTLFRPWIAKIDIETIHFIFREDIFDIVDTYASDCKNAVFSKGSDYEDAVMIETAVRTDMDAIVTRNQKDFTDSSIPVYLLEEFLAVLGEN